MDLQDARRAAEQRLLAHEPDGYITDSRTIVRPSCYLFFWSLRSVGDEPLAPGLGAPLLVARDTGTVYWTTTQHPSERFVEAFERFGDPMLAGAAGYVCTVTVTAAATDALERQAIVYLRDTGAFTLQAAKDAIRQLTCQGTPIVFADLDETEARALRDRLSSFRYRSELTSRLELRAGPRKNWGG